MKYWIFTLCILVLSCNATNPDGDDTSDSEEKEVNIQLDKIQLPDGFKIELFAEKVPNARSMALSPDGTLFVGTRRKGSVYALRDNDQDGKADKMYTLATGLQMPNGVAVKDGDLYIAEVSRILRFSDIESKLDNPGEPEVIYDGFPDKTHHGWKYISFGPDGMLYVPVGAPCNICENEDEIFTSLTKMDVNDPKPVNVQTGIRNTVGFTWHPETNELWFTDNGGDWLGEDMPACELNYAPKEGMNFGFPYCHQGDYPDPKLGHKHDCSEFTPPAQKLGPHTAPLGLEFVTSDKFPSPYKGQILIAEHGSWNRTVPIGYRITMVPLNGNVATGYQVFAEGWLQDGKAWGRPVDLEWMPDGSMLISDDFANAIYRVSYGG